MNIAPDTQPKNEMQEAVQLLREAWSTLHNLSVDMEAGPVRQQMQRRAAALRAFLNELELPDGTYRATALPVGEFITGTGIDGEVVYLHVCEPEPGVSFPLYAGPRARSVLHVSQGLIEAIDKALEEAHCDCPHRLRFDEGQHLSSCPLFDLNIARLEMLSGKPQAQTEKVQIAPQQELQLWHLSHEAHCRTSAFEWFQAGIAAAEHFHNIASPASTEQTREQT